MLILLHVEAGGIVLKFMLHEARKSVLKKNSLFKKKVGANESLDTPFFAF